MDLIGSDKPQSPFEKNERQEGLIEVVNQAWNWTGVRKVQF